MLYMAVELDPSTGPLPVGEHEQSWKDVCDLFGFTSHRAYLLGLLHKVCIILRNAGVQHIWLNGSFVTSKKRPGDYDISYELTEEVFDRLPDDPFKLVNADTKLTGMFGGDIRAEPMPGGGLYHKDLFPNVFGHMHKGESVEGVKKGIVKLILETVPDELQE